MNRKAIRLFWEQCGPRRANFGDRLTEILLSYVGVTCVWAPPNQADLIGIGSILEAVPNGFRGTIWTSGRMYSNTTVDLQEANVIALRGRLSLEGVKLSGGAAPRLGDGGLLCGMFAKKRAKKYKLGVIPHYFHAESRLIKDLAARTPEIALIDICAAPQAIIEDISRCEAIVSSSLHGLIAADALEVPNAWIEVQGAKTVGGDGFKYRDYYSIFGDLALEPHCITAGDTLDSLLERVSSYRRPGLDAIRAQLEHSLTDVVQLAGGSASRAGAKAATLISPREREHQFVTSLESASFSALGSDELERAGLVSLERSRAELQNAAPAELAEFFLHCLRILRELRAKSICHNDIREQTVFVCNRVPVLGEFVWARYAAGTDELHADVLALAAIFRRLNDGRYALFGDVTSLMAHPNPELRMTDPDHLAELFSAVAVASASPDGIATPAIPGAGVMVELLSHIKRRDERLDVWLQRQWTDDAYVAKLELLALQPRGRVILVDNEACLAPMFDAAPFVPFLEKSGRYWGPPPDDETAISELERLRSAGAEYIAFTWPAFWWLDYYVAFGEYLSANFAVTLVNGRLRVFDLRTAEQRLLPDAGIQAAPAVDAAGPPPCRVKYDGASRRVAVDLPLELLQAVRLTHALTETRFEIQVAPHHDQKLTRLRELFGIRYGTEPDTAPLLSNTKILHTEPLTAVGKIERPLILPHGAFEYCRQRWTDDRPVRYSFAGLMTNSRKRTLQSWSSSPETEDNGADKAFVIMSSDRGRKFPEKSWDEEYFALLCNSKFVLCPNGDYVWTYRFFEAAMCGAIPIVEEGCAHYAGFEYRSMSEGRDARPWSEEAAMHNYRLCRERLTVPLPALESEIQSWLDEQC